MYISLNWLKDFVKIPAKLEAADIAKELTDHTVEVEGFINQAEQFNNIVVGKVLEVTKHPNADRLRLAVVDVKKKKLHIVCGAPNLAEGQLVPVALIGAIMPNGLEIKESEIRGEKSYGMICAEDELGIGKNHEGILVLDEKAKIGEPFAKYLKADDIVLEVDNKSLSNRPDLLSHYGIARELGVLFDLALKPYKKLTDNKFEFLDDKTSKLEVKIDDKEACPRYMAVKVEGIEVKESPTWLKERLIAVNQNPINNIVDLTNYVMFECGQPMHAFDAAKVEKINVRHAHKEEILETLDEKERNLNGEDIIISDGKNALAIAGIMGGKDSGISNETKIIIVESANFKASVVRKTSQRLGLRTESSTRFEKSLDPDLTKSALFRFLNLLAETCPNMKIDSGLVDINSAETIAKSVELDFNWLTNKIGQEIPKDRVIKILKNLGFIVTNDQSDILNVVIPSWRATKDVSIKEDLAEEVLRIYGYDNIISRLPVEDLRLPEVNQERLLERKIKNILALKYSLDEVYNYSFVGEDQLKKLNIDFFNYLRITNPLSEIHTMPRQSLVSGLVGNIKTNQAKADSLGFFEFGNVFFNAPGSLKKEADIDGTIPYQEKHLGLVLASAEENLFGRLKGLINNLLQNLLGYDKETEFSALSAIPGWADKNLSAKIIIFGREIGIVAIVDKEAINNINIKKITAIAEINFSALAGLVISSTTTNFKELAKYPVVVRDLAFVINEKILYNEVKKELIKFNPLIRDVELFDVYVGNKLAGDEKSLAWHISFQSEERTLTAEEVDSIIKDLIKHLGEKFEARLRD
jgi:phenylalanyl-tRNA synthetase beta chain